MRELNEPITTDVGTNFATEPINIVKVLWDTGTLWYGDKELGEGDGSSIGNAIGCIGNLSPISHVLNDINQVSTSGYSLTLYDNKTQTRFLTKFTNNKIYKTKCELYQAYLDEENQINSSQKIHDGEITSPVEWNESTQSLNISIETILDDSTVGYTLEESDFTYATESVNGKSLPVCYGEIVRLPAVQVTNLLTGTLEEPITSDMFDIGGSPIVRISNADKFPQSESITLVIDGLEFTGTIAEGKFTITSGAPSARYEDVAIGTRDSNDSGYENRQYLWLSDTAYSNGIRLRGYWCVKNIDGTNYINYCLGQFGKRCFFRWAWPQLLSSGTIDEVSKFDLDWGWCKVSADYGFTLTTTSVRAPIKWEIPSGSDVMIDGQEENVAYILNNRAIGNLKEVLAYRKVDGEDRLVNVPSSYFSLNNVYDFKSEYMSAIEFTTDLRLLNEEWDVSNIYVSFDVDTSLTVIQTIKEIINDYSDFTADSDSFDPISTDFANIKPNLVIFNEQPTLQLARELAYQCGCGLYIDGSTVKLKDIYKQVDSTDVGVTLTNSEIDLDSLVLSQTPFLDVLTRAELTYNIDYNDRTDKLILENNTSIYGKLIDTKEYSLFSKKHYVDLFGDFWLKRTSNVWKIIKFKTYINALALEPFDSFILSLSDNPFGLGDIICVVRALEYDTNTGKISIEAWTPIKAATTSVAGDAFIELTTNTDSLLTGKSLVNYNVNIEGLTVNDTYEHGQLSELNPTESDSTSTGTGTGTSTATDTGVEGDGLVYGTITGVPSTSVGYYTLLLADGVTSVQVTRALGYTGTYNMSYFIPILDIGTTVPYVEIDENYYLLFSFTYTGSPSQRSVAWDYDDGRVKAVWR